ncbi:MAG: glycosyltransferase family 9 protein [Gammaproteobacteria bacterium]
MSGPARSAVLWGGGLGDTLVVRPLLQALARDGSEPPVFMTRVGHIPALPMAFGLPVSELRLTGSPLQALSQVRRAGRFDLVYLGPHATSKTRLLARGMKAGRIWTSTEEADNSFIGDVVRHDVVRLGLAQEAPLPYGGVPVFRAADAPISESGAVVLHIGAKSQWETKKWPTERWQVLVRRMLTHSGRELVFVGAADEAIEIQSLLRDIPESQGRVRIAAGLDFAALEGVIAGAHCVICHNSGIMHLAAAWQKPTVVLTGASARYWRPPYPWVRNVTSGLCELACNRYRCPVPGYNAKCIKELGVTQVWVAVAPLLN